MSELAIPKEWKRTCLGDVVPYGKTEKVSPCEVDASTWVLELEDIEKDSSRLLQQLDASERQFKSTKNKFKAGDVLYGKLRPYLNKVVVAPKAGVCTTEIIPMDGGLNLDNHFLFHWLKSSEFLTYVTKVGYGVNMPRLGTKDGVASPFILPPLAEQKEIAARLDDLLAQVDSIKTRLDGLPAILKRFRQSVLAAAVSGKLTEEWRGSNSYSSVDLGLSKRSLVVDFPNDWKIEKLVDSCGVISGNAFKSKDFIESGVPVIKISNVQYGEFEVKNQQYLPESFLGKNPRFIVQPSDVLMALTRPITNDTLKICRYPDSAELGLLNQRVCKFDFTNDDGKRFFELLFQSDYFKAQVEGNLSETLQPNLSPTDLKKFIVGIPDTEEQTEIVRRVTELFAFADQVEQRVKEAQAHVNHLTQSILAKAFRGELTADWRANNPDLITGENSAAALLKRIKAEREKLTPKKKTQKRK